MSWRTVIVNSSAKLELRLNYLICRGEEERRIPLSEIATLIIESTAVCVTAGLLSELMSRKISVIFCDSSHNPQAELMPYYGCHDVSNKIREQIAWQQGAKTSAATVIIYDKIKKQRDLLRKRGLEKYEILEQYLDEMEWGDVTNREGHAAKVYFNVLFGIKFSRNDDNDINSALNYGYSILLAAFNREIVCNGYLTQLGINHCNSNNQFNLASDLMEPYRILVDSIVADNQERAFDSEYKHLLVDVLNREVVIGGEKNYVNNAIKKYCRSVFDAINNGDSSRISFYDEF